MSHPYKIREAITSDLPMLAQFEADIARISFPDDAISDLDIHLRKLQRFMDEHGPAGMLVAVDMESETVSGWVWTVMRTNFLTGQRYASLRSLAVRPSPDRSVVGELLLEASLEFGRSFDAQEIVGKVYIKNIGMRVLYRKFGFRPAHLTMRRRLKG